MENLINRPGIVVICGPTGIGKTALAICLAEAFGGEIIGADSMQVYRYMDIGTAKPSLAELGRVRHHMIGVIDPASPYDAAKYSRDAGSIIMSLGSQHRAPFVVGGTGLYIKALIHGLFEAGASDPELRRELKHTAETRGRDWLYQRLVSKDPDAAGRIHPNDTYRIIRALEIYELTGRSMSESQKSHGFGENRFETLKICLVIDRKELYDRINRRVEIMIEQGLEDEVRGLLAMGYSRNLRPMQSIGYRHMMDYIDGNMTLDETISTLKRDTRRYAKRQFTWFKKDPEMIWQTPDGPDEISQRVKAFLELRPCT
ncbi:MAG: tRNA (adenosine(37)-N6)-dimethylallyltransferase MiaA [Deltaproteobacteria bacterium]|nr:tRNA (adenosine(37)-N6)-dimethylallyltransferase MiaA [Deltaproteobacteria bacterium]